MNISELRIPPPEKHSKLKGFRGFTLAEVLITLGIIGVVAAMTIPVLTAKYREKETISKLKKFYSTMSQAYLSITYNHGQIEEWGQTNSQQEATALAAGYFREFLNVSKDCAYKEGCFKNQEYYTYSHDRAIVNFITHGNRYMMRLNDGSAIAFYTGDKDFTEGSTVVIYYDVNGDKMPNTFGKDLFQIEVTKDKVVFAGQNDRDEILTNCLSLGYYCAAWVLLYENMDYIKCPDYLKSNSSAVSCK